MFTGLIEDIGRVRSLASRGDGARLSVETRLSSALSHGESIAVNGVCLTVVATAGGHFEADAVAETLRASTLGTLRAGHRVNLERALRLGDRLGGHIVTGHVDGVAVVTDRRERGSGVETTLELRGRLATDIVRKGSVTVDGTSLTVAAIDGDSLTVAFIPETLAATISGDYRRGTKVNVETDILAKHLRKLLAEMSGRGDEAGGDTGGLTLERLRELGF